MTTLLQTATPRCGCCAGLCSTTSLGSASLAVQASTAITALAAPTVAAAVAATVTVTVAAAVRQLVECERRRRGCQGG